MVIGFKADSIEVIALVLCLRALMVDEKLLFHISENVNKMIDVWINYYSRTKF